MNTTPELTSKRLAGLQSVTAKYNKTKKREFDSKPENKDKVYTPITDEEYIQDKVGKVLDSYWEQTLMEAADDESNWGLYIKALENKSNPEVAATIQKLRELVGMKQ